MIMDIIYEGFVGLGAIGKRIRSYRKHNGLKQGELAEKAGIDTNNNLSAEVAEMLKDLTPENYRKIIEYIRFVGQSK